MKGIFNILPGSDPNTCCILLYGEIGNYCEVNAQDIVTQLFEAERTYRKIDVRINSCGGEVYTGIAIFNALRQSKAEITIYIDCIAASTASFIAGCGRPVHMSRYARMMLHRPTGCAYGDASKLKNYIEQLEQIETTLCEIYATRTGLSVEQIRERYMDGDDHWLTADEALKLGFVDSIYDDMRSDQPVDMLTPQQLCERYTAQYFDSLEHSIQVSLKTEKMIEKLKTNPAFSNCADEAAVMARIDEIVAKASQIEALTAERDALQAKLTAFEQKEREAADAAIANEVNDAVLDGRIGEDQREHFVAMLHGDKATEARAVLSSLAPKRMASAVIDRSNQVGRSPWDERFDEIRANLRNN